MYGQIKEGPEHQLMRSIFSDRARQSSMQRSDRTCKLFGIWTKDSVRFMHGMPEEALSHAEAFGK